MLQLKFISSERELDLPIYSLSEKKNRTKSTFVDSNRVDTVPPAIQQPYRLTLNEFIKSDFFREIVYFDCNEAMHDDRVAVLLNYFNAEQRAYLIEFFENNNFGVINFHIGVTGKSEIKLNENITFEDIENAYISELKKFNLSDEKIKSKKMILKKKINNGEN